MFCTYIQYVLVRVANRPNFLSNIHKSKRTASYKLITDFFSWKRSSKWRIIYCFFINFKNCISLDSLLFYFCTIKPWNFFKRSEFFILQTGRKFCQELATLNLWTRRCLLLNLLLLLWVQGENEESEGPGVPAGDRLASDVSPPPQLHPAPQGGPGM